MQRIIGESVSFRTFAFFSKEEAIERLLQWYVCSECGILSHPKSVRQRHIEGIWNEVWVLGCGHSRHKLDESERVQIIKGKHQESLFLSFVSRWNDVRDIDNQKFGAQYEFYCQWGESFLTQYYLILQAYQNTPYNADGPVVAVSDTGGTSRNMQASNSVTTRNCMCTVAGATLATFGIQAGTGTTANGASTKGLDTLIANGSGAGQLNYGSMGITAPSGSAPEVYTWTRTLTNNSGGGITVNEFSMNFALSDSGATERYFAVIRDVNAGGIVTIVNLANTTGTYSLFYTIS